MGFLTQGIQQVAGRVAQGTPATFSAQGLDPTKNMFSQGFWQGPPSPTAMGGMIGGQQQQGGGQPGGGTRICPRCQGRGTI